MPAQPLVDLSALDLSRTIFEREDMQRILRQRGRFSLVDGVLYREPEKSELIVGYIEVRTDAWWAADHIPGRPLLPGVLMVEASAQLGSFDFFLRHPELQHSFAAFTGIDGTRFRATVEPPCRLYLVGRVSRFRVNAGKALFTYLFQGQVENRLVFETEVTGMQL